MILNIQSKLSTEMRKKGKSAPFSQRHAFPELQSGAGESHEPSVKGKLTVLFTQVGLGSKGQNPNAPGP